MAENINYTDIADLPVVSTVRNTANVLIQDTDGHAKVAKWESFVNTVNTAKNNALSAIGETDTSSGSARKSAIDAINSAKTNALNAIGSSNTNGARGSAITEINSAKSETLSEINSIKQQAMNDLNGVIATIPNNYQALSNKANANEVALGGLIFTVKEDGKLNVRLREN